jgi:hypothetical protein
MATTVAFGLGQCLRLQANQPMVAQNEYKSIDGKRVVHIRAVDRVRRGKGQVDRDVRRPRQSVYVDRYCKTHSSKQQETGSVR